LLYPCHRQQIGGTNLTEAAGRSEEISAGRILSWRQGRPQQPQVPEKSDCSLGRRGQKMSEEKAIDEMLEKREEAALAIDEVVEKAKAEDPQKKAKYKATAAAKKAALAKKAEGELEKLAVEIRKHHELCDWKKTLDHAITAGSLLETAKKELPHGEWGKWVEENCGFTDRTARQYMRFWENRQQLWDHQKTEATSVLNISGAVKLLTAPKKKQITAETKITTEKQEPVTLDVKVTTEKKEPVTVNPVVTVKKSADRIEKEAREKAEEIKTAKEAEEKQPWEEEATVEPVEDEEPKKNGAAFNVERFALDLIERMKPSIEYMAGSLDIFIENQRQLPWSLRKDMKVLLEELTKREEKIWLNKNNKLAKEKEAQS